MSAPHRRVLIDTTTGTVLEEHKHRAFEAACLAVECQPLCGEIGRPDYSRAWFVLDPEGTVVRRCITAQWQTVSEWCVQKADGEIGRFGRAMRSREVRWVAVDAEIYASLGCADVGAEEAS